MMSDMIGAIPIPFWVFAGIALIIVASGYAKGMSGSPNNKEIEEIKQRLDRVEQHLDLRN